MPNYCDYTLKVKGNRNNCEKFLAKMKDYNEDNHFWRIFESSIEEKGNDYLIISGHCAWSIESCCRASGYSNGVDLFAVNTKDLNLDLEVWSSETDGGFFEEHYIYKKGECLVDECREIEATLPFWEKAEFPTFAEYCAYWGFNDNEVSEDNFDSDGGFVPDLNSGFDEWGTWSI